MPDPKDPQAFQRVGIAQVVDVNNQTTPDPTQLQHPDQPQDLAQALEAAKLAQAQAQAQQQPPPPPAPQTQTTQTTATTA
ncbi:hypothetical protein, partial [Helicobacter bizzozeronii]|uniref:hypothetical protein n=1 Tax=Helicobacter bizzozeronii TaxID=56877 RepID=UPI0018F82786